MPEVSRFHGIIRMYYDDRHQPHFHAYYGQYAALYSIDPPALYEGAMPRRQQNIIPVSYTHLTLPTKRIV